MNSDRGTGSAARIATGVAVPVALLAGVITFQAMKPTGSGSPQPDSSTAAAAQPTGPVPMPATPLTDRPAAVCRALAARLPERLGNLARRPVTAGAEQNAAYGEPPVTLACGRPGPSAPPDAQYLRLNGVCWYAANGPNSTVWSLVDREVPVLVTVPNQYQGQLLVGLSASIEPTLARTSDPCA